MNKSTKVENSTDTSLRMTACYAQYCIKDEKYNWDNLKPHEKQRFYDLARDYINNNNYYLDQYTKEELEEVALQIFEMNIFMYVNDYCTPLGAKELLSRYDIVIENDGVKIMTGLNDIEEARRVKKALKLFIEAPYYLDRKMLRDNSRKRIKSILKDIDFECAEK